MPRLLIIDDDAVLRSALRIILEGGGFTVEEAGTPAEGAAKAQALRPDAILLDVMMPQGTEGFHFVWALRSHQDQGLAATPIIVLTAIHGTTDLRFGGEPIADGTYGPGDFLPVQAFLDKPVSPDALLAAVRQVLAPAEIRAERPPP